jgi:hypothetical protein
LRINDLDWRPPDEAASFVSVIEVRRRVSGVNKRLLVTVWAWLRRPAEHDGHAIVRAVAATRIAEACREQCNHQPALHMVRHSLRHCWPWLFADGVVVHRSKEDPIFLQLLIL